MSEEECDVDALIATVLAAAKEAASHVVEAILAFEDAPIPVAGIDADDLAALIRAVRPRIVYCFSLPFEAAEQVNGDLFDGEGDVAAMERPRVKKLLTKWRSRDGQTAQVAAAVVADGVLHGLSVNADWYADYQTDVAAHSEETDWLRGERERRAEAEIKRRLDPFVDKLMADPRFAGPKVGRAKRLMLAEDMFPDEDKKTLGEAVDLAEGRHWLATGR